MRREEERGVVCSHREGVSDFQSHPTLHPVLHVAVWKVERAESGSDLESSRRDSRRAHDQVARIPPRYLSPLHPHGCFEEGHGWLEYEQDECAPLAPHGLSGMCSLRELESGDWRASFFVEAQEISSSHFPHMCLANRHVTAVFPDRVEAVPPARKERCVAAGRGAHVLSRGCQGDCQLCAGSRHSNCP